MRNGTSVFVKVDEYKDILDVLDIIKNRIEEIRKTLNGMNELRKSEDAEVQMWHSTINDIEKKIESIDRIMYEHEQ